MVRSKRLFLMMVGLSMHLALTGCSGSAPETKPEPTKSQALLPANPAGTTNSPAANTPPPVQSGNKSDSTQQEAKVGLAVGNRAPDFTVTMTDGRTLKLSQLKEPIFLNFWASWCPPCKQEMPDIERISKEKRSVQIIAIDVKEGPEEVRRFLRENGYSFPVGLDEKGEIASLYRVTGIPTSLAIDRQGIIRYKIMGPLTYNQLNRWFSDLESLR